MAETEDPNKAAEQEIKRAEEIIATATKFDCLEDGKSFVNEKRSVEDFHKFILNEKLPAKLSKLEAMRQDGNYGTTPTQRLKYNLGAAILEASGFTRDGKRATGKVGGLSGFELEMEQELLRAIPDRQPNGFLIPEFALDPKAYFSRTDPSPSDYALGNSQGGNLIQTTVEPALIPLLRNKMVVGRAGCTMMGGLVGNMALPRQITAATATWNTENATSTTSGQTFDQVLLNPQRLAAMTAFSKQLLAQGVIDAQTIVRDDLLKIIAIAQDLAALAGTGGTTETGLEAAGDQPIGILSLTADTQYPSAYSKASPSITFGSGYPTWTNVVAFEGNVEQNNIDLDDTSCAYITSPSVKQLWKTVAKADPRSTTLFYPEFLWQEVKIQNDARAGQVNGYPAFATNQLSATNQVIFGKFSDLVIGTWGGLDIVTDPYSLAASNQIRIIVNLLCTIAFRYGPAFVFSTNSGLQH